MIDYALQQRRTRARPTGGGKRKFLLVIFFFFLIWGIFGSIRTIFFNGETSEGKTAAGEATARNERNSLKAVVDSALAAHEGEFGVVVKNLKTNETYSLNEHKKFDSASLYKLWVMATVFEQIGAGRLREQQELQEEVSILNEKFHIASESAELTEGTVELTVSDALEKMITISDNYAALILTAQIRLSTIAIFLEDNGFKESRVSRQDENPETTASDIALFFEKLYRSQLADPEATEKMLALLRRQRLNEKLPKSLPEDMVIAHKTGELGTISHDSGIVYAPSGDYIIVILTDTKKPLEANVKIAAISRAVYDYFSK